MDELERHCQEIERCNQRGGRMLSLVDLLEADTLPPSLGTFLLAAIQQGASFMVGALPGGAGKTTVMGALLNLAPAGVELRAADSLATIRAGLRPGAPRACYIAHEIGPGHYFAYLWGNTLRAYFELAGAGHILASNLHADSLPEAQAQICQTNGVATALFRKIHLILFLQVTGGWPPRRWISEVWESDGQEPHRLVYQEGRLDLAQSRLVSDHVFQQAGQRLEQLVASGARTLQAVRMALLHQQNPFS